MHGPVRIEFAPVHRRDHGTASRRSGAGRAVRCAPSLLSGSRFLPRTRQRSATGPCPTPFPVRRPLERSCPHQPQRLVSIDRERFSPSSEWAPCECAHLCQSDPQRPSVLGASGCPLTPKRPVPIAESHNRTAWPTSHNHAWRAYCLLPHAGGRPNSAPRSTNSRTGIRAA